MLRDKSGNRLFRKMTVKVIYPDNIFPDRTYVQRAGSKQGLGPDGVASMLDQIAEQLDALYPFWDFTPIELAPEHRTIRFVFKFAGYRAVPAPPQPITDSNTPEPETTPILEAEAAPEAPAILQHAPSQELVLGE